MTLSRNGALLAALAGAGRCAPARLRATPRRLLPSSLVPRSSVQSPPRPSGSLNGKVLIADANYSASTNANPAAARIHLNVRPGLVTVADVLEPVLAAVPIEAVEVMTPDGGGTPEVWGVYRQMLREGLTLRQLGRFDFYAACREPDVAVCVATGDAALYSNVLLTIGYLTPEGEDGPPA